MADPGTIILKRGINMPYDNAQDDTPNEISGAKLFKGEPGAQIVGLSEYFDQVANATGVAKNNYPNRLWMGMQGYGGSVSPSESEPVNVFTPSSSINANIYAGSPDTTTTRLTRPLWMGAEIRAYQPLKEDGSGLSNYDYVILKADWNKPSDYVLVTQKAISAMPLRAYERKLDATDTTPPDGADDAKEFVEFGSWSNPFASGGSYSNKDTVGQDPQIKADASFSKNMMNRTQTPGSIKYCFPDLNASDEYSDSSGIGFYNPFGLAASGGINTSILGCINLRTAYSSGDGTAAVGEPTTLVQLGFFSMSNLLTSSLEISNKNSVAILGSDGVIKGPQIFQSPIGIDNYLELNSYSVGEVTYPATIKSANSSASIFDTNVTDISIGGASELIEIGDQTTDGTTSTVIYGDLTVTGDQVNLTNATQINAPNGNLILNGIKGIVADSSGNIYITGNLIVSGYLQTDVGLQGGPDAEKEYVGEGMVMDGGTF